jgi:hypothetical protein
MTRQRPPATTPAPEVIARVGLASQPAEVLGLSPDRVLLLTSSPCARGRATVLEPATADRAFRRLLPLRVTWSAPYEAGLHAVAGEFARPPTPGEVRAIACPRQPPIRLAG